MRVMHKETQYPLSRRELTKLGTFDQLVGSGKAVEATVAARPYFQESRVAIESAVFERYVGWASKDMRMHGLYLDERSRLTDLLRAACSSTRHESPCEFTHKTLASDDIDSKTRRHSFVLQQIGEDGKIGWLIRQ